MHGLCLIDEQEELASRELALLLTQQQWLDIRLLHGQWLSLALYFTMRVHAPSSSGIISIIYWLIPPF